MKTRNKIIIIGIILFSVLIVIPSAISIISTLYCNSIFPEECVVYSITLIGVGIPFNVFEDKSARDVPTVIDPRITQITNSFVISSNIGIFSIDVIDEQQAILFGVKSGIDGFIYIDDPLPILQKLFPDRNIVSIAVLSDDVEIPYTLEDGKLRIQVSDTSFVWIIGFSKI